MADRSARRAAPEVAGSALHDPEQALAPVALTFHQAAVLVGAYRWAEERLFALTGGWSADPAMGPEAQVHLFELSAQHAWHADLWADRLPVLDGFDRQDATRPRGPVLEPLLTALEAETVPSGRLAGLARVVVPELAAAYRHHLGRAVPVTDGPVIRTLHVVLADLDAEKAALERVLAGAGLDPGGSDGTPSGGAPAGAAEPAEAVEAAVGRLEAVLEAAGGPVGVAAGPTVTAPVRLVPWPGAGGSGPPAR